MAENAEDKRRWEEANAMAQVIEQQMRHLQQFQLDHSKFTKLIDKVKGTLEEMYHIEAGESGRLRLITETSIETLMMRSVALGYLAHEHGLDVDWPYISDELAAEQIRKAADSCECPRCQLRRQLEKQQHSKEN